MLTQDISNLTYEELGMKEVSERITEVIHEIIVEHNPKEYERWGGNCCKQTGVFLAFFLDELFQDWEFTVWEGQFNDIVMGREVNYNHAWILAKDNKTKRRLLIDMARNLHDRVFTPVNTNKYPKDLDGFENMIELSREKLNWRQMLLEDIEYYTQMPSLEFAKEISKRLM